jgi:hypothetical protein
VDATNKQLPSQNKVNLALDKWTSTNQHAITSVVAYYIDHIWTFGDIQIAFEEGGWMFLFFFRKLIGDDRSTANILQHS